MKIKILSILFFLTLATVGSATDIKAIEPVISEARSRNEIRNEIRNNIKEIRDEAKTQRKEALEKIKEKIKDQRSVWEKIKEIFPKILPTGFKEGEVVSLPASLALPAEVKIKYEGKEIILKVTEKTLIFRKYGGKSSLSEMKVGDKVSARGTWVDEGKTVLEARVIKNLSIQKRPGAFWGKIKSIDLVKKTFILDTGKGDQTVLVTDLVKLVSRDEKKISFSDLAVGHRVRVTGVWDSSLKQIESVKTIKDWSIHSGAISSPTITPTITPI